MTVPPQTTRARLRGEFVAAAQDAGRDYTVDWVHLKLNDQAQRTVLLKDPFRSTDDRVTKLIGPCSRTPPPRGSSTPARPKPPPNVTGGTGVVTCAKVLHTPRGGYLRG